MPASTAVLPCCACCALACSTAVRAVPNTLRAGWVEALRPSVVTPCTSASLWTADGGRGHYGSQVSCVLPTLAPGGVRAAGLPSKGNQHRRCIPGPHNNTILSQPCRVHSHSASPFTVTSAAVNFALIAAF